MQDTWLALLNGLDRFEQRSSLKTWLLRVLANIARTRAVRERRSVPMSALAADGSGDGDGGPRVDPARFRDPDAEQWPRHWMSAPRDWRGRPELVSMAGRHWMSCVGRWRCCRSGSGWWWPCATWKACPRRRSAP